MIITLIIIITIIASAIIIIDRKLYQKDKPNEYTPKRPPKDQAKPIPKEEK